MLEEFLIAVFSSLLCPSMGSILMSRQGVGGVGGVLLSLEVVAVGSWFSCLSSAFATCCVTLGQSHPLSVGGTLIPHKCAFTTC